MPKRTASVKANLTPQVYERLKILADRQGQTPAILASVAIGQYVANHMAALDVQRDMADRAMAILERMPQQLLELEAKL
jgi:predicted transcriptional regulator